VEHVDVYTSGTDGYHTYRIPAIVRAGDGSLLAFAEGRKSGRGDAGDIDLLMKRSRDGGRTWSAQSVVWDDGENTCGNPCPVLDRQTGTLWLLATHNLGGDKETDIIHKRSVGTRTVWVLRSDDNGATWTRPVEITTTTKVPAWGWYATGPGVGVQIERGPHAGRLVIPANHSFDDPAGDLRGGKFSHRAHVLYSDDRGKTWQLGGATGANTNESQLIELAEPPGGLLINMRSYFGRSQRTHSVSRDGGLTWTAPADQPALSCAIAFPPPTHPASCSSPTPPIRKPVCASPCAAAPTTRKRGPPGSCCTKAPPRIRASSPSTPRRPAASTSAAKKALTRKSPWRCFRSRPSHPKPRRALSPFARSRRCFSVPRRRMSLSLRPTSSRRPLVAFWRPRPARGT
jgi:hypothetical protein